MDKQQALKILGLTGDESADEINNAFQTKLEKTDEKSLSAPTDALKKKFQQLKDDLEQAHKILASQNSQNSQNHQANKKSSSPLSQTKMADLPGVGSSAANSAGADNVALEVGQILDQRYEIKAFIAQGGMGVVYRAFDKNRNEDIAIKIMLPALMQNDTARERFLDEARLSSQLSHPNIVNVFDVQQSDGLCFLTMELLEGQDLRELMENRKLLRQNFTLEEVLEVLIPICAGLDHAHEITVHRDIKPENIYLTEDGKYKLMDFGIARVMSTSQRTQTGAASGTAYYMAPEQLKGAKNIDGRADQYALAVLTYELLSGEVPAGAIEPLHEIVKGINKKISASVQKALSPKPENRFATLTDFLLALKGKGKGISVPTPPIKGIGIAAVILIAILGIGFFAGNGGLNSIWDALKPVDKALIAQQQAELAKLQGEIKNYQKRLEKGQRNLTSDVRDAQRNDSNKLKYLAHWQRLTDDYLFDGDDLTELEGELSMGDNLARQGQQENNLETIQQANVTLTKVRDGYKHLWAQFNAAETLLKAQEQSDEAFNLWNKRKKAYNLDNPSQATDAAQIEEEAKQSQREGDFVGALEDWQAATKQWQNAYHAVSGEVASIDRQRVKVKADNQRIAEEKRLAKERNIRIMKEKKANTEADKKIASILSLKQAIEFIKNNPEAIYKERLSKKPLVYLAAYTTTHTEIIPKKRNEIEVETVRFLVNDNGVSYIDDGWKREFDKNGRVIKKSKGNKWETYQYNSRGYIEKEARSNGVIFTYEYDSKNRQIQIKKSNGSEIIHKYDQKGRKTFYKKVVFYDNDFEYEKEFHYVYSSNGNGKIRSRIRSRVYKSGKPGPWKSSTGKVYFENGVRCEEVKARFDSLEKNCLSDTIRDNESTDKDGYVSYSKTVYNIYGDSVILKFHHQYSNASVIEYENEYVTRLFDFK